MPRRMTDEEVKNMMEKKISNALYPVLIPVEEQCCQIQEENAKVVNNISKMVWKEFLEQFKS